MNSKRTTSSLIGMSLFFAAAMLISAIIFADSGASQTVRFLVVALWLVPFFYIVRARS